MPAAFLPPYAFKKLSVVPVMRSVPESAPPVFCIPAYPMPLIRLTLPTISTVTFAVLSSSIFTAGGNLRTRSFITVLIWRLSSTMCAATFFLITMQSVVTFPFVVIVSFVEVKTVSCPFFAVAVSPFSKV